MEIFKDFGIQPILLLAQIVNFVILLVLLKKFLYKPILKLLDERKNKIAQAEENAKKIQDEFDNLEQKQKEILSKASKEASILINDARTSAEAKSEKIVNEAKETAIQILDSVKKQSEQEKIKLYEEAKVELVSLVVKTTSKVVGKVLNEGEHQKLIKSALMEVEDEKKLAKES